MLRTHTCGELRVRDEGKHVKLCGWVDRIRDLGGVRFVDLRDRYGETQIVCDVNSKAYEVIDDLTRESVILVEGTVRKRPKGTENPNISTGEIEVVAEKIEILSAAQPLPFYPNENPKEEMRLKYRYIDLRSKRMQNNIILRYKVTRTIRNYFDELGFLEIETPFLTKSTPEGARDFLVPSRLRPGKFYALPQSPQLFKQLLMISGFDRYFQIVRCFRDEDLRADRQPEFTQVDVEMSFVDVEDVLSVSEGMIARVFKEVLDVDLSLPFDRLRYHEAMEKYGTDKPDRRYGMELQDFGNAFEGTDFKVIRKVLEEGGSVKGFVVPNFAPEMSRKRGDELMERAKELGLGGLLWFKIENGLSSPHLKHLESEFKTIAEKAGMKEGDVCLIAAHKDRALLNEALGTLRLEIGKEHFSHLAKGFDVLWVIDFPYFEWSEEEERFVARHHPFTMPVEETLDSDHTKVRAKAYDIVINGYEVGGGSIRIHKREIQEKIFQLLGISKEEAQNKFGFFLEAFKYGVPPHGGIAFGLDRLVSIITGENSIREVIPFPKTGNGVCLLTGAPSEVDEKQLKELRIRVEEG
ncbi:aspartate--tRNA ligase [Thermotoga sp. KOL6]|uniref:aspartate--tRNA ligase n=1 Tax=Thermotoga sp. KOL6 TaxID=126741 RepID=UPI000C75C77C|nr:aspartate--tRNA ligase [Thermotoga sp. KOL6]PLV60171.1 aspartyl-tRNA synthetase [Thermotoga sp. KOL6]